MNDPIPHEARAANLSSLERVDQGPREERLLRRRGLQGRGHVAVAARARGARAAGPRGHDAAAPAVPLRPGHAQLGTPRRRRGGPRLLRRSDRAGAEAGRRSRPRAAAPRSSAPMSTTRTPTSASRLFDIVFVSWGAIEWLPDLDALGQHRRPPSRARRHVLHGRDPPVRRRPRRGPRRARRARRVPPAAGTRPARTSSRSRAATPTRAPTRQGLVVLRLVPQLRRDPRRAHGRRPARRAPARVPHLPGSVLGLDGARRSALVVATGR